MSTKLVLSREDQDRIDKILSTAPKGKLLSFELCVKLLWSISTIESIYDAVAYTVSKVTIRDAVTIFSALGLFIQEAMQRGFVFRYDDIGRVLVICFRQEPTLRRALFDEIPDVVELVRSYDIESRRLIVGYRAALSTGRADAYVKANPGVVSYYTDMCIAEDLYKSARENKRDDELWQVRQSLAKYDATYNAALMKKVSIASPHEILEKIVNEALANSENLMSFDTAFTIAALAYKAPTPALAEQMFDYLFDNLQKADMITINMAITMYAITLSDPKDDPKGAVFSRLPQLISLMNNYSPFKHYVRMSDELNEEITALGAKVLSASSTLVEHSIMASRPNARSLAVDRYITAAAFNAYVAEDHNAVEFFFAMRERINNIRS